MFLLLLTSSASTCLQHSPNRVPTIISPSVNSKTQLNRRGRTVRTCIATKMLTQAVSIFSNRLCPSDELSPQCSDSWWPSGRKWEVRKRGKGPAYLCYGGLLAEPLISPCARIMSRQNCAHRATKQRCVTVEIQRESVAKNEHFCG